MYNDRHYSLTRFSVNRENRALDIRENFSEVLGAAVPVDFRDRFSETAQLNVMGTVSVVSAFSALAELTAAAHPSVDVVSRAAFGEALQGAAHGKKNTSAALTVSEVLTSMLEATSQTTERTTVQLTIPPGAELRIDSERFLVLLDGENVLHTQSDGGWRLRKTHTAFQNSNGLTPFGIFIFPSHTKTRKMNIASRFTTSGTMAASYTASCRKRLK